MLPHPTHDRLIALGLVGMAKAFEEQRQQPAVASLTFEERLGLLVDREAVERQSKRLVTRLKFASLRQNATVEDPDGPRIMHLTQFVLGMKDEDGPRFPPTFVDVDPHRHRL